MRHVFTVFGSEAQLRESPPQILRSDAENQQQVAWYACADQDNPTNLLDDRSFVSKLVRAPMLAYRFYLLVHNTKLWSGKRPLIIVRGRSISSRVAAYAGRWGGGDVVMPSESAEPMLGPTRYLLLPDGSLELRAD